MRCSVYLSIQRSWIGFFEQTQMLHDAEAGHVEVGLELGQRPGVAIKEQIEQFPAGRVGERFEDQSVVHAANIGDCLVTYQDGFDIARYELRSISSV
jgi:hypothetical protein